MVSYTIHLLELSKIVKGRSIIRKNFSSCDEQTHVLKCLPPSRADIWHIMSITQDLTSTRLLPKRILYSSRHVLSGKVCYFFLSYISNFGLDANFIMYYIHIGKSVAPISQNLPWEFLKNFIQWWDITASKIYFYYNFSFVA